MSLTSFISIPQVKEIFRKQFPLKQVALHGEMRAVPITKNYPLVGTAFDYLFRFHLESKNPNCVTKHWVAENSIVLLEQGVNEYGSAVPKSMLDALAKMKSYFQEAQFNQKEYLKSGILNDRIVRSAIILAQMDVLYRSGRMYPDFGKVDDGDVQDLQNLIALVEPNTFKARNSCYLNPTFGYGSELVGGADADLIVDNILIDIKTTKFLSFTQDHYNQLIGYYILSKLGKINESDNIEVSKMGIYFSRHGILHTISAEQIENNPIFPKFVDWFERSAKKVFGE